MNIVLWGGGIIAGIGVLLLLIFFRPRRHKCRGCRHFAEQYITSLHGEGLFRFGYCQLVIYDTPIVEPDIGRKCEGFERMAVEDEGVEPYRR